MLSGPVDTDFGWEWLLARWEALARPGRADLDLVRPTPTGLKMGRVGGCGPRSASAEAARIHACIERSYAQMTATKGACVALSATILIRRASSEGSSSRKGRRNSSGIRFSGGMKYVKRPEVLDSRT